MVPLRLGVRFCILHAPPRFRILPLSLHSTIGDWFPERNVFQILIALTSGPRFLLILLALVSHRQRYPASALPGVLAFIAAVRTVSCGGWVFITSSDHGDAHDVFMVLCVSDSHWLFHAESH